jgi:hypothetical protein
MGSARVGFTDKGIAGQIQFEDAQAGDAIARDAGWSNAYPISGCCARIVPARDGVGAHEKISLTGRSCAIKKARLGVLFLLRRFVLYQLAGLTAIATITAP